MSFLAEQDDHIRCRVMYELTE